MGEFRKPQECWPIKAELVWDSVIKPPFKPVDPFGAIDMDGQGSSPFIRISVNHGRAVTREGQVLWRQDGIPFGALDWKGVVMKDVKVESSSVTGNLRTRGLFTDFNLGHLVETSRKIRSLGLATEMPIRAWKLEEVIYNGKKMPIEDWKRRFVVDQIGKTRVGNFLSGNVRDYLNGREYYLLERAVQVPERLADFLVASDNEVGAMIDRAKAWLRLAGTTSEEDLQRNYWLYMAQKMGNYLGRLHSAGIAHGDPHVQNWSQVGTLYDLDSAETMEVGEEQFERDLNITTQAWEFVVGKRFDKENITKIGMMVLMERYMLCRRAQIARVALS